MTPDENPATVPTPEQRAAFLDQLATYLAAMYPRASPEERLKLIKRARRKRYFGRLGKVAGILADTFIRHERTDYEYLMSLNGPSMGLTRAEARREVRQEVQAITDDWRMGSAEGDAGYAELHHRLRKARRKKGKRKDDAGAIANENAAIAEYLTAWLERGRG